MRNRTTTIAVFATRESFATLKSTIECAAQAASGDTVIDVLINGNSGLAGIVAEAALARRIAGHQALIRIWEIAFRDKAHAWNLHIHAIWSGGESAFYLDGYARLRRDAVKRLSAAMHDNPRSLGGSGAPTSGRDAARLRAQLLADGGFHGNFCAIKGATMDQLKARAIRLPLGLYRTDGTMGAILSFGLDPASNKWNPRRYIAVDADATWSTDAKAWWRWTDLRAAAARAVKQAQGQLENAAVRDFFEVRRSSPETLPPTASELVLDWIGREPEQAEKLRRNHPLTRLALRGLIRSRDWLPPASPPLLRAEIDPRRQ